MDFMFSFSLDSSLTFVEHISSNFLRKHLGGKSFEIVQVCETHLPLHVDGLARYRILG